MAVATQEALQNSNYIQSKLRRDSFQSRYKLLASIGEGTYSQVLKCKNRESGITYACKRLKQIYRSWFQVNEIPEIQTLRRLTKHPNILHIFEIHFDPNFGQVSLIFELMEMNLYELIRDRTTYFPECRVKLIMFQLIRGLRHLHKHGVFHRDVKPENVLIKRINNDTEDLIKIGDLGSVRGIHSRHPFTEYISTRWYRSPECLLSSGFYGLKMDMWAVGCVFFETLTLSPLFPGNNEVDQIDKIHKILGPPSKTLLEKFIRRTQAVRKFNMSCKRDRTQGIELILDELAHASDKPNWNFDGPESQYTDLKWKLNPFNQIAPRHLSQGAKDLLCGLLQYDPDERLTAHRALNHPYFFDFRGAAKKVNNTEMIDEPPIVTIVVRNSHGFTYQNNQAETQPFRNKFAVVRREVGTNRNYNSTSYSNLSGCDIVSTLAETGSFSISQNDFQENESQACRRKQSESDSGVPSLTKQFDINDKHKLYEFHPHFSSTSRISSHEIPNIIHSYGASDKKQTKNSNTNVGKIRNSEKLTNKEDMVSNYDNNIFPQQRLSTHRVIPSQDCYSKHNHQLKAQVSVHRILQQSQVEFPNLNKNQSERDFKQYKPQNFNDARLLPPAQLSSTTANVNQILPPNCASLDCEQLSENIDDIYEQTQFEMTSANNYDGSRCIQINEQSDFNDNIRNTKNTLFKILEETSSEMITSSSGSFSETGHTDPKAIPTVEKYENESFHGEIAEEIETKEISTSNGIEETIKILNSFSVENTDDCNENDAGCQYPTKSSHSTIPDSESEPFLIPQSVSKSTACHIPESVNSHIFTCSEKDEEKLQQSLRSVTGPTPTNSNLNLINPSSVVYCSSVAACNLRSSAYSLINERAESECARNIMELEGKRREEGVVPGRQIQRHLQLDEDGDNKSITNENDDKDNATLSNTASSNQV